MLAAGFLQDLLFVCCLLLLVKPLGLYIKKVFANEKTFLDKVMCPIELAIYRLCGIKGEQEQTWYQYAVSLIIFSFIGLIIVYTILRLQFYLPFNPQNFKGVASDLAFNTAASFTTNTNWQAYAGESTLSYFSQMAGLAVQNFLSAAVGIAVCIALIRAFARQGAKTIGNFWFDLVRAALWILLPISVLLAIVYVWQGVPENLHHYVHALTLTGGHQVIPQGPVATQEVIKSLGTNGGGFFNANSAHPYENPTPLTNFLQVLSIFVIGAALTNTFGRMVKDQRQGWTLLAAMGILFAISLFAMSYFELHMPHKISAPHVQILHANQNMEGKEVRFGVMGSALYNTVTTSASNGGVNSMLDSYTPLGGGMALANMQLGEIIVGGAGAGLYGMLMYVLLAVFIAGLMVGRTPEFLGKKIEAREVKMVILALLIAPLGILLFTAIACVTPEGLAAIGEPGAHGFSQILYNFTTAFANNGSAFAGLNGNVPFYKILIGIGVILGRYCMIIPVLAVAGSLVKKPRLPQTSGSFVTTGPIFVLLLIGTILLIAGLTFFPALSLGPIVEHLLIR